MIEKLKILLLALNCGSDYRHSVEFYSDGSGGIRQRAKNWGGDYPEPVKYLGTWSDWEDAQDLLATFGIE